MGIVLVAVGKLVAIVVLGMVAFFLLLPWGLACLTVLRDSLRQHHLRRRKKRQQQRWDDDDDDATVPSPLTLPQALSVLTLYKGRVWHTRYRPVLHEFTYPVFLFEVDLSALHLLSIGSSNGNRNGVDGSSSLYDDALCDAMWPLSIIVQFRPEDHLKNGEGTVAREGEGSSSSSSGSHLLRRVQNMLLQQQQQQEKEREKKKKKKKKQDHRSASLNDGDHSGNDDKDDDWNLLGAWADHDGPTSRYRVGLLTNLSYYNYCFNPVSYYLVFRKSEVGEEDGKEGKKERQSAPSDERQVVGTADNREQIRAVVGEVSNTPWGEMHCYVLLPDGSHQQQEGDIPYGKQQEGASLSSSSSHVVRFVFPKTFHVSPFMEMHYDYDWSFRYQQQQQPASTSSSSSSSTTNPRGTTLDIHNSLVVINDDTTEEETRPGVASGPLPPPKRRKPRPRQFHARLLVHSPSSRTSIWSIAYQLSKYPVYGLIVQLWIHYQALMLFFVRRVEFQPHPHGSETRASQIIGALMAPFFALLALREKKKEKGFASGQPDASNLKKQM
jgi:DUF1365 family protein